MVSRYLAGELQERECTSALIKLINFLKFLAYNEIGNNQRIFKKINEYYKEIVEIAFKKDQKEILDEVFRSIG